MKHMVAAALACLLLAGSAQGQMVVGDGINTSETNLQLWLRADLGVTTDGGGVTDWVDQSANGYAFDLLEATRVPGYIASDADANGQATVDFSQDAGGVTSGSCLKCDASGVITSTGTVFNVIRMVPVGGKVWASSTADGTNRVEIALDSRTTASRRPFMAYERLSPPQVFVKIGDEAADPNILTDKFAVSVLTMDLAGETTALSLNGDPDKTTTVNAALEVYGVPALTLGGAIAGGSGYDGSMAEMIVYDRVLSAAEIFEVASYLATRYDIAYGGSEPPMTGDANDDGLVDDDDLSLLLSSWGQDVGWENGNFNGDNIVDDDDLSLLLSNWTGSGAVPEPASAFVLLTGFAAVAVRSRRK